MDSTALFLFKQFSACHLSNPPLRRYRSSVSPLYFAQQNTGEKCTMYPYTETETPLSILSPCVSVREYRGSVRRTRGLTLTVKNLMPSFSHPLLRNYRFFGLFPIFFYTIPRNAIGHGEGEGQTRSVSLINNEIEGH